MTYYSILDRIVLTPNAVIMQCTGLFDKNNKLIYEKDVVAEQINYRESKTPKRIPAFVTPLGVVEWSDLEVPVNNKINCSYCDSEGYTIWNAQSGEWEIRRGKNNDSYLSKSYYKQIDGGRYGSYPGWIQTEIKGNIFENPELIGDYKNEAELVMENL